VSEALDYRGHRTRPAPRWPFGHGDAWPGWIPQTPFMVGFFEFTPEGTGTRYRAGSRHWGEAAHRQHEQMGFMEGWGKVADQLAELAEAQR
jgi:uncharacterized protein YndB with AHSA1/START domain